MKRNILYITLFSILGICQVKGQTAFYCENCNVNLRNGAILYVEGDYVDNSSTEGMQMVSLDLSQILVTGNIIQNGITNLFKVGDRTTVNFAGNGTQFIQGSSAAQTNFYNVDLSSSGDKTLQRNISVNNIFSTNPGNLKLETFTLELVLDPSYGPRLFGDGNHEPKIFNESNTGRVYGINGKIRIEGMASSSYFDSFKNLGNIGAELLKPGMTDIHIERGHQPQTIGTNQSIKRYYDILSGNSDPTGGSLKFHYLEGPFTDIPNISNEEDLVFFKRNINSLGTLEGGAPWLNDSISTINISGNNATRMDVPNLYDERFTLVECSAPAVSASSNVDSVCVSETVTLDAGSGTGWTYLWSNGEATQTIDVSKNFMVTEKFYVIVQDSRGCVARDSVEVAWLDYPTIDFTPATETVCDGSSLELNPTVTGTNLSYLWSTGETTPTIMHTSDGNQSINYSVTVTSYNRCAINASKQVDDAMNPVLDLGEDIVNCDGDPQTIIAGPASGFVYEWRNDEETVLSNSHQYTVSETGYYSVDVTEIATGCNTYDDIRVGISDIQLSYTKNDVQCNGQAGGNIVLTINGVSGDYLVEWSNGAETVDLSGVVAGTYSVTVTDMEGCSANLQNITIAEPTAMSINPIIVDDLCDLGSGSIISNLSGGVQPYQSINWYNQNDPQGGPFASTQDVTGLSYGEYVISIIDANGCQFDEILTVQGGPINPTFTPVIIDISCPQANDGSIAINNVSGGNAPYSFAWSSGETTSSIMDLEPGDYSVTVTDVNGCLMLDEEYSIIAPDELEINLVEQQNVLCNGDASGSISISVTGDAATQYSVLWSTGATSEAIAGRLAGLYSVTVTFGNNCMETMDFEITEPAKMGDNPIIQDDLCGNSGGSISTGIVGGVGPYTYKWSNGATTPDISSLNKGTYSLTITDANNCTLLKSYFVDDVLPLTLSEKHQDLLCIDDQSGRIDILHTGGTPINTYLWATGETTRIIEGLSAGTYFVTATDANGCTDNISVTIQNPDPIIASANVTDATSTGAADGSINLDVSGGAGEYTFSWSNGETTQNLDSLLAGIYDVTIIDANDCPLEKSFVVSEPNSILVESEIINLTCFGDNSGSIQLSLSGGVEPYSYSWSNGENSKDLSGLSAGSYSVTIYDNDGITTFKSFEIIEPTKIEIVFDKTDVQCNSEMSGSITASVSGGSGEYMYVWSSGEGTNYIEQLTAGNYELAVTDNNGCQTVKSIAIEEPELLSVTISSNNVSSTDASDGSISLEVNGGTSPYTYLWSNGQISSTISNLPGGDYSVTISDKNGCSIVSSAMIFDPSSISASADIVHIDCGGDASGSIDITMDGGSEPYEYLWSNGEVAEDISGLVAGEYKVTITDNNGLIASFTYEVTETDPITINSSEIQDVDCGGSTGSISIAAIGGTGVLTYLWTSGETTNSIENKEAGNYEVTISDESGCSITENFEIASSSTIELETSFENSSCGENFDGSIDLTISGGSSPYTISWSNGQISEDLINLGPGTYVVTVTDSKSCNATTSVTIEGGASFTLQGAVQDVSCFNANDGAIAISVDGGSGELTYEWSNGESSQEISGLDQGVYSVTVTDENGCSDESSFAILEPDPMTLNLTSSLAGCTSENDGSLSVQVSGGSSPFTYLWSTSATSSQIIGLSPGTYTVTVTDAGGCSSTLTTEVQRTDQMLTAKFLVASPVRETETLQFLDLSFPKPNSWLYKFGDLKNSTSQEEDPLFRYPNDPSVAESIYNATLIVSSIACIDSTSKEVRIINTRSPNTENPNNVIEPFYTEIEEVKVYPNPAMEYVNTEISLNQKDKVDIRLVNMNGQILRHFSMNASQVYFERINLKGLTAGYYFIYVTSGADSVIKKIVVVK
ncbi:T9SS type A sorting domain-containing protein [Portibacter lacus]|uniref:Secretion system C-terminal sorting domain-containing protein n=1 Tax=Portibacter lacus TaxID=1099794 RepID=A0AA37SQ81_9BACT|nr:T9SS type A sorting domain-containing protein [Portibacter lacus]GLR15575.1 hypothetical protein GCM10007940_01900 [Portibacter lacus]